ncbi:MAG: site-2 protease family protein [Bacteroidota bacterium]
MSDSQQFRSPEVNETSQQELVGTYAQRYLLHSLLFFTTFLTTTIAGVFWLNKDGFDLQNFHLGLSYSISILFILASHEFGHYFAAKYHKVKATLPFFIPFPPIPGFLNFGTLGAVIRTRSPVPTKKVMFDIGIAGPIAGFIATLIVLSYGFLTLPGIDYLYTIHPEYRELAQLPEGDLSFGTTFLYWVMSQALVDPSVSFLPPMNEMYHYPFLCVGWFGLFVTAMNLIPIGQLDGGHIAYAMFGSQHRMIARTSFATLLVIGLAGFLPVAGIDSPIGWTGWLFWAMILFFVIRLDHPPIDDPTELDPNRRLLGWTSFVMLVLCFSSSPFNIKL